MKKRRKTPAPKLTKVGAVLVFKPGTRLKDLGPVVAVLRESGIVESVQLFTETTS